MRKIWIVCGLLSACSSRQTLVVRSTPAEANVCIKGTAKSRKFSTEIQCVGQTPLELDSVVVRDKKGRQREIDFGDVHPEKDGFFIVLSRPGYQSESVSVPAWMHDVALKPEVTRRKAKREVQLAQRSEPVIKQEDLKEEVAEQVKQELVKPKEEVAKAVRREAPALEAPELSAPELEAPRPGVASTSIIPDRVPVRAAAQKQEALKAIKKVVMPDVLQ